jgi:hypothetical protein
MGKIGIILASCMLWAGVMSAAEDYFPWVRVRGAIVDGELAVFDGPSGRYIRSGGTNAEGAVITMTNYVEVAGSSTNWEHYDPATRTLSGCHTNNEKGLVATHTNTPAMTAHPGLGDAATNPATAFDAAGSAAAVGTNLTDHTNTPAMTAHPGLGDAATNPATAFDAAGSAATVGTNLTDHTNTPAMDAHAGLGSAATNPATAFYPRTGNPDGFVTNAGFSGATITLEDPTNSESRWIKYVLSVETSTEPYAYVPPSTGTIYYVAAGGNDTNAGTNWDTAVASIHQGMILAGASNTVWVGDGVWTWNAGTNTFTLDVPGVVASYNLHGAIIDGAGLYEGFIASHDEAHISGFYVRNCGEWNSYGGITISYGKVSYCIVSNFISILMDSATTILENSIITHSTEAGYAPIQNYGTVRNCLVYGNEMSDTYESIIEIENGALVENCTIIGNLLAKHGALYVNTSGAIRNSIIFNNWCTYYTNYYDVELKVNMGTVSNSCIGYAFISGYTSAVVQGVNGCISNDPAMVNAPTNGQGTNYTGNFNLTAGSPCYNTGTNADWMATGYDLPRYDRIIDGIVDMGAYEYVSGGGGSTTIVWKTEASSNDYFTISRGESNLVTIYAGSNVFPNPIYAPNLVVTNAADYLSILKSMTNFTPVASSSNYLVYDSVTRTLSGCVTNKEVTTNDTFYLSIAQSMTNFIPVASSSNYLTYDTATRLLSGCVTNQPTGSTTNLTGMVWDNGATTGTLSIVNGNATVSVP